MAGAIMNKVLDFIGIDTDPEDNYEEEAYEELHERI